MKVYVVFFSVLFCSVLLYIQAVTCSDIEDINLVYTDRCPDLTLTSMCEFQRKQSFTPDPRLIEKCYESKNFDPLKKRELTHYENIIIASLNYFPCSFFVNVGGSILFYSILFYLNLVLFHSNLSYFNQIKFNI